MLRKFKDNLALTFVSSLLSAYETEELESGRRLISTIAGVYFVQKGIRDMGKNPVNGIQKLVLGGILLYTSASDLNKKITKKPKELSDIRKNQIQGNDPRSVPEFV
ncbi:hypothetical protein [Pedobacter metabolipauper]|uniref:Uncharacterized protein n=1 Tax=Pedobacter metabolipauper TaxID=425513 RepID=A0A4R6T1W9_9SPHI|nr:hypothetical protein [Pedobacter metabolipauper]TDQ11668.1 hypothetical protein ATK78_0791 [Pedobacter metabolipauper]